MRRTQTRARILALTERHLMQRGYHGFSFRDLAAELSVRASAVHYHFPTKPDLVVAAIQRYGRRFSAWVDAVAHLSPAEQLLAYVALGQLVVADGRTCALGMLQSESATLPEEVRNAMDTVYECFLEFYTSRLSAARSDGQACFSGPPQSAAEALGCTLLGAQHLGRSRGTSAYVRAMQQQTALLGLSGPWPRPPLPPEVHEASTAPHAPGAPQ